MEEIKITDYTKELDKKQNEIDILKSNNILLEKKVKELEIKIYDLNLEYNYAKPDEIIDYFKKSCKIIDTAFEFNMNIEDTIEFIDEYKEKSGGLRYAVDYSKAHFQTFGYYDTDNDESDDDDLIIDNNINIEK